MGKNSNAHVKTSRHLDEIQREREREAQAALKRAKKERNLAAGGGPSAIPVAMDDGGSGGSAVDDAVAAAVASVLSARRQKTGVSKKFSSLGHRKLAPGITKAGISKSARGSEERERRKQKLAIRPSLTGGKKGPRKPSPLMKRTLKKLQKRREEEMGIDRSNEKRRSCRI